MTRLLTFHIYEVHQDDKFPFHYEYDLQASDLEQCKVLSNLLQSPNLNPTNIQHEEVVQNQHYIVVYM